MIDAEFAKLRPGSLDPEAGRAVADDPNEVSPEDRVTVYDAMADDLRAEWDRRWRADAHAWVDAVPDPHGQGIGDRGPDGWRDAITFPTTDGGLFVV